MIYIEQWGGKTRELARYKRFSADLLAKKPPESRAAHMWDWARYSRPCYLSTMNKTEQERFRTLYELHETTGEVGVYHQGLGYVQPYTRAKQSTHLVDDNWVYMVEAASNGEHMDQTRPKVRVGMCTLDDLTKLALYGGTYIPKTEEILNRLRYRECNMRYVDRLTKEQQDKLSLLYLVEPGTYLAGVGAVIAPGRYDRDSVSLRYFLEM